MRLWTSAFVVLLFFQAVASSLAQEAVDSYLSYYVAGNLSLSQNLLDPNVILSWHGSPSFFPSLGGDWMGKAKVEQFYMNKAALFNPSKFRVEDISYLGSELDNVLVQYTEFNTVTETNFLFVQTNTLLFHVADNSSGSIDRIDIFLDTENVLSSISCASPVLYCGLNGPGTHVRMGDLRFPKPLPNSMNSNASYNSKIALKYLTELSNQNVQGALGFLADNVSLTYQANQIMFPALGGVWSGKTHIEEFFSSVGTVFTSETNISFWSIEILMSANNSVLVQYEETKTARLTQRTSLLTHTVIFTFNDFSQIVDIEILLDTSMLLDVMLCSAMKGVRKFTCTPEIPDKKIIVLNFLDEFEKKNLSSMYQFFGDSSSIISHIPAYLFPSLGGNWISKEEITKYYTNVDKTFYQSKFLVENVTVLASSDTSVVVQYVEHNTAIKTNRAYVLLITAFFYFGQRGESDINTLEMFIDSASFFSVATCMNNNVMCTGQSSPAGSPRKSDLRATKPAPSSSNSNITLNKIAAEKYLTLISEKNFESSLFYLSETVSFTWQANSVFFPSLGGTWTNRERVQNFYDNFALIFDVHNFSFTDQQIVAENNVVVCQHYEHNKAIKTNRSYHEISSTIFSFKENGVIEDVEIWVNTAAVLDAALCQGTNLTCASDSSPPVEERSKAWIAWFAVIFLVLSLGTGSYAFFRFRQRKIKAGLHEGLLGQAEEGTVN